VNGQAVSKKSHTEVLALIKGAGRPLTIKVRGTVADTSSVTPAAKIVQPPKPKIAADGSVLPPLPPGGSSQVPPPPPAMGSSWGSLQSPTGASTGLSFGASPGFGFGGGAAPGLSFNSMPTATGTGLSFNNITLGSTQPESGFGASVMPRPATGQFSYTWEESGKLGMSLNHRQRAPYVMLSKVSDVQRQNALAASGVEPGMVITKVGVQSVATADYLAVMDIIKDASRPLTIWFADEATANSIADQAEQGTAPTTRSPLSQRSEWQETVSVEEIESEMCTNVFLDVNPSGAASKRIEIELFDCVTPRTAENFRRLCVGDKMNMTQRKPLSYQEAFSTMWCQARW